MFIQPMKLATCSGVRPDWADTKIRLLLVKTRKRLSQVLQVFKNLNQSISRGFPGHLNDVRQR